MVRARPLPRITSSTEADLKTVKVLKLGAIPQPLTEVGSDSGAATRFDSRPCFASSWVERIDRDLAGAESGYIVDGVSVTLSSPQDSSLGLYVVDPPEYRLDPLSLKALGEAIEEVARSVPDDLKFDSLEMARPYIKGRAKDVLYSNLASRDPAPESGTDLEAEVERLSELLCKYTAGYGVLETLLKDDNVQDIYVDAPSSQTHVYVVLRSDAARGVRQKCRTNIMVGRRDLQGIVSRVKLDTGLPFCEASPVLEAELPGAGARITVVGPPVSQEGVAVAIRKHSRTMWTMPQLVANHTLSPLLSSFLWACVAGRRTVLLAGSRGAGKTTLLGSMILEFPLAQRVVVIEDTPEIPVRRLQELGYDVQSLRFLTDMRDSASSAQESLRVSLRMGESALVLGEVRGREARVLYESMRAGSAGSSVLGTIHANSASGVLQRAVEDLGISERAFSSTDVVVVMGLVRSPDGSRFTRRVAEVAEVRESDGRVELAPLFETEPGCACAKPTGHFSPAARTMNGLARALGVSCEKALEVIKARAHADQLFSEYVDCNAASAPGNLESLRIASNEVLGRALFQSDAPEHGLEEWRAWFDSLGRGR